MNAEIPVSVNGYDVQILRLKPRAPFDNYDTIVYKFFTLFVFA